MTFIFRSRRPLLEHAEKPPTLLQCIACGHSYLVSTFGFEKWDMTEDLKSCLALLETCSPWLTTRRVSDICSFNIRISLGLQHPIFEAFCHLQASHQDHLLHSPLFCDHGCKHYCRFGPRLLLLHDLSKACLDLGSTYRSSSLPYTNIRKYLRELYDSSLHREEGTRCTRRFMQGNAFTRHTICGKCDLEESIDTW